MGQPSPRLMRGGFLVLAVVLFGLPLIAVRKHAPAHTTKTADLSQLITRVERRPGSISRVVFDPGALLVTATLAGGNAIKANYPSDQSALKLQDLLERQKVDFGAKAPSHGSALTSVLISLLPLLLFIAVWIFVI